MNWKCERKEVDWKQKTIRKSFTFTNIFITLVKFPSSGGIGPVSWFTPKSKTLRFFNKPISFGIVPISEFPCKILPSPGYQNNFFKQKWGKQLNAIWSYREKCHSQFLQRNQMMQFRCNETLNRCPWYVSATQNTTIKLKLTHYVCTYNWAKMNTDWRQTLEFFLL